MKQQILLSTFIVGILTSATVFGLWYTGLLQWPAHQWFLITGIALIAVGWFVTLKALVRPTSSSDRRQGTVKWFNPTKGFGFIAQDEGEDLFVHQTEIQQSGFRSLSKGDRVEFEIGRGKKGPVAKNVARLEEAAEVKKYTPSKNHGTRMSNAS